MYRPFIGIAPDLYAEQTPAHPAIIETISGRIVTYQELARASAGIAGLLQQKGLAVGAHIAILSENSATVLEVAWACQRGGYYYTLLNTHLTPDEILSILRNYTPSLCLVSPHYAPLLAAMADRLDPAMTLIRLDDDVLREASRSGSGHVDRTEGQWLLYSSGTSGAPKGVKRRPRQDPYGTPRAGERVMRERLGFDRRTVYLGIGPLYHMGPLSFAMGTLRLGGTVILMQRFDAEAVLRLIAAFRVTHLFAVPTYFRRLLDLPLAARRERDLRSLRVVLHAAAPCSESLKLEMIDWWGPIFHEFYGTTEGIGSCIISTEEWLSHRGSVGRPVGCAVSILDRDGNPLPPGRIGQIHMKGADPFEYHGEPELTAAAFDADGRVTVGDLGYLDAEGYLYLTGRATDLIITGGVNVAPQDVEAVLAAYPGIVDAAVFGVADDDLGERVEAAIVLASDAAAVFDDAHLIAHLRRRLAGFKCPRRIHRLNELPRSETGKILRRVLSQAAVSAIE